MLRQIFILISLCSSLYAAPAKPLGGAPLPKSIVANILPQKSADLPQVIEITKGQIAPTPIAIIMGGESEFAKKLQEVVKNDLNMCGRFRIIGPEAFIQDQNSVLENVRFNEWRLANAQILVTGKVFSEGSKLRVEFRVFDVFKGTLMVGLSLAADEEKWRKLAHMVSDAIFERVMGDAGLFDSQIVFIDERGKGRTKKKRLMVMDLDGHNPIALTSGENLVLTPRFSPSTQDIAYLRYNNSETGATAGVYLMDIKRQTTKHLGNFEGMTFAPRFSPDGSTVVMSLSKGSTTAIYTYNPKTKEKHQLTQHAQIDTSPCYSPDGKYIVFTSDRNSNVEKLFIMDANGGGAHQISTGQGQYSQPIWSPRGDTIAFSIKRAGVFYLGVMKTDGTEERLIDQGYLIEGAAWSPNGRYITYTKEERGGKSTLHCIDLSGMIRIPLKTPNNASDPAWSPLLSSISVRNNKPETTSAASAA